MSLISIILILISAIIHAGWNLVLKKENDHSLTFVLQFSFFTAFCAVPILIILNKYISIVPLSVVFLSMLSGLFLALYSFTLNKAYQYGEISLAYPIVRSLPIILVAILSTVFALGEPLSILSIVGMVIIISGCFMLPMKHLKDIRLKNYINIICFFSLIAALGTSGYSIIDDISVTILNTKTDLAGTLIKLTFIYASLEFIFAFLWILLFLLISNPQNLKQVFIITPKLKSAAIVGIGSFSAYFLVLLAMSFVTNISYVVSFRQLSIPLGALLGVIIFKEKCSIYKIMGIIILLIGLLIVATF
jgi:drug/metabolite transporter (DMT)-like permease